MSTNKSAAHRVDEGVAGARVLDEEAADARGEGPEVAGREQRHDYEPTLEQFRAVQTERSCFNPL